MNEGVVVITVALWVKKIKHTHFALHSFQQMWPCASQPVLKAAKSWSIGKKKIKK